MKTNPIISFFVLGLVLVTGIATPASALDYQGRSLKLGSKGDDVVALQTCLVSMGFSLGSDGWFGQETHNIIANFQQSRGLAGDGIVGPYTSRLLDCKSSDQIQDDQKKTNGTTSNTNAVVVSSSVTTPNDTALFSFKLNLSPFQKTIYVPTVARAAVQVLVITPSGDSVTIPQKLVLASSAPQVTGTDGNTYYQVAQAETFTVTSSIKPGRGSYRGKLGQLSFTSQDVLANDYAGFMGVSLPLDETVWTTKTLDIQ